MIKACVLIVLFITLLAAGAVYSLEAPYAALLALLVTQPLALLALLLPGVRLSLLCGPSVTLSDGFGAVCVSVLLFKVLPSRLSEGAKPLVLHLSAGCPLATGAAAVAIERFLDIVCVAALIALALILSVTGHTAALWSVLMLFTCTVVAGCLSLMLLRRSPQYVIELTGKLPFALLRRLTRLFVEGCADILSRIHVPVMLALSAATWVSAFAIFYIYFSIAGSIPLEFSQVLTVYVFATLGLAVAIAPGGLGTYEGAIVASLAVYGYAFHEALLAALILRLANMAPAVPVTLWYLGRHKLRFAALVARIRHNVRDDER